MIKSKNNKTVCLFHAFKPVRIPSGAHSVTVFMSQTLIHPVTNRQPFSSQQGLYLFQDAGEPLGLTVDDNLSLLPLVQILEHFQERGLRHGLHVHRGHQPVPLCCCVQNLLQY